MRTDAGIRGQNFNCFVGLYGYVGDMLCPVRDLCLDVRYNKTRSVRRPPCQESARRKTVQSCFCSLPIDITRPTWAIAPNMSRVFGGQTDRGIETGRVSASSIAQISREKAGSEVAEEFGATRRQRDTYKCEECGK